MNDFTREARFQIARDLLTLASDSYAQVQPSSIGREVAAYYLRAAASMASELERDISEDARINSVARATSSMGGR